MKVNKDKNLERFVDKLMKKASPESPSTEFTAKLMMEVHKTEMDKVTVYKPLISKRTWFIIFGSISALALYVIFNTDTQTGSWLTSFDLGIVSNGLSESLRVFKFSTITFYAVALLTVMLFVQITYLRNYFDKRVEE
ncbi:MAG: hypothetical protein WBP16_09380 [Ferruginibacter sp.]